MNEPRLALTLGVCALTLTAGRGARALDAPSSRELIQSTAGGAMRAPEETRFGVRGELAALSPKVGRGAELTLGMHENTLLFARGFTGLPLWSGGFLETPGAALEKPKLTLLPDFLTPVSASSGTSGMLAKELAASTPYNDPRLGCAGPCMDTMPRLSTPDTLIASMAVLGIGLGMGLAMASSKTEPLGLPPLVRFKLTFRKAVATTTLRF